MSLRLLLIAATFLLAVPWLGACNDRTRDPEVVFFGDEDAGATDAGRAMDQSLDVARVDEGGGEGEVHPTCEADEDGTGCSLDNASGVCIGDVCQFVSCLQGWADCDGDVSNGCETDIVTATDCGACGTSCPSPATCQLGPAGPVCSGDIVCPSGKYDLDFDSSNGCEWVSEWESGVLARPLGMAVQAAGHGSDGFVLAGVRDMTRYLSPLGAMEEPLPLASSPESASAVAADVSLGGGQTLVAWEDGVSVAAPASEDFFELDCSSSSGERAYVAVLADGNRSFAATEREIFELATGVACPPESDACVGMSGLFGQPEYLQSFFPYPDDVSPAESAPIAPAFSFGTSEVAACDACVLDQTDASFAVPPECLGERVCRDASFEPDDCSACSPLAGRCPDFEPRDILKSSTFDHLYVVTARGVVGLRPEDGGMAPVLRVERSFDPAVSGGPSFVAGAVVSSDAGGDRLTLAANDGTVLTLDVQQRDGAFDVRPVAPQTRVGVFDDEMFAASVGEATVIASPTDAVLYAPTGRGSAVSPLGDEGTPGGARLKIIAAAEGEDGLVVLYESAGQMFVRKLTQASSSP